MAYLDKNGLQRYHNGIKSELNKKADINGTYEELFAGHANDLRSADYRENNTPYLFRKSGGDVDSGGKLEESLIGGTIAWNQLAIINSILWDVGGYRGITVTKVDNSTIRVSGTVTITQSSVMARAFNISEKILPTHVYFVNSGNSNISLCVGNAASFKPGTTIRKPTEVLEPKNVVFSLANQATSFGENGTDIKPQIIDLTRMFGTTIADYVYGLETATAGSGVAWLKKYGFFTKDYYPYSAPTFKHVEGIAAHQMVGFNAWDEQWEVGGISSSNGENVTQNNIRSKNYIPVLPSTDYYLNISANTNNKVYLFYYDSDKNYIGNSNGYIRGVTTIPSGVYYVRFQCNNNYGYRAYNNDICIHLYWDGERDGEYEAYKKWSYPLDSDVILRGIPKLDSANNLYFDGDTYNADGTVGRRYTLVDLGTLTWTPNASYANIFNATCYPNAKGYHVGTVLDPHWVCTRYMQYKSTDVANYDKGIALSDGGTTIYVKDSSYTDSTEFKAAMSGVYLVYERATPTEETADPFQSLQNVDSYGTEEYVLAANSFPMPVGHKTIYTDQIVTMDDVVQPPETDGTYALKTTVTNGNIQHQWVDGAVTNSDLSTVATSGSYSDLSNKPTIPSVVSQLTNDSGFQTASDVSTAIATAVGNITEFSFEVVQELPQTGNTGVIYLVAHAHGTGDAYDEYIWTGSAYEKIGNTDIDLSNYVTNTDYATQSTGGVVKVIDSGGGGFQIDQGYLVISPATHANVKTGSNDTLSPIVPATQHEAAFYGLAKAAGDTTQSQSNNAVGTYTDDAKAAIRSMIGAAGNFGVYVGSTQPTDPNIVVWIDTDDSANIDGTWEGGSY